MQWRHLNGESSGSCTRYRRGSDQSEGDGAHRGCRGASSFVLDSRVGSLRSSTLVARAGPVQRSSTSVTIPAQRDGASLLRRVVRYGTPCAALVVT